MSHYNEKLFLKSKNDTEEDLREGGKMLPRRHTVRDSWDSTLILPFRLCAFLLVRDKPSQGVRSSTLAASSDLWVNLLKHRRTANTRNTHTYYHNRFSGLFARTPHWAWGDLSLPWTTHKNLPVYAPKEMHKHALSWIHFSGDQKGLCVPTEALWKSKWTTFILNFFSETPALSSPLIPSLI